MEENKIYGYIYKITNDFNDLIYVGKTTETVRSRFNRHCRDRKNSRTYGSIDNLIQTIGREHFNVEEIEKVPRELLNKREQYWINYYDSFHNGYNRTLGGEGNLIYTSEEINKALDMYYNDVSLKEIQEKYGLRYSTLHKYRKMLNLPKRKVTEHELQASILNAKKATEAKQIPIENITLQRIYSSKKEALCDMIEQGYSKAKDWHNIRAPLDKALSGEQDTFLNFKWRYIEDGI